MAKLLACVSVMLLLLPPPSESSPRSPCCTNYQKSPVAPKRLEDFIIQEITAVCNIRAVIFKTVRQRLFCADPNQKWVKKAMQIVSRRKA